VIGQQKGPEGETADLVQVRTELLSDLDLDAETLEVLQAVAMRPAGMAGPVYDPVRRTLDLCSLVRVYPGIEGWMQRLIGMAAVLQLRDAWRGASALAEVLGATPALSAHPLHGPRPEPDARIADAHFGSFGYEQGTLAFQSFFPNLLHRPGLIMNLYLSCAERARLLSMRLTGVD
jgi:hypothetical protein